MIYFSWKKIAYISLGLSLTINTHASSRDGIYAGVGVGAASDSFDLTAWNKTNGFTVTSPTSSSTSVVGDLFLGYGHTNEYGFYLAGELGTYFPKRTSKIYNQPGVSIPISTFTDTLGIQDYLTLDVLPGYRLNEEWLFYGRLGLSYANASINETPSAGGVFYQVDKNKLGGRIGAGINYAVNSNVGIGVDYFYTKYQQMTSTYTMFNTQYTLNTSSNFVGISAFYSI